MNFLALSSEVHDKQSSVQFLQRRGIIHNVRMCRNQHAMTLRLTDRKDSWRCDLRTCREEVVLRKGTWLEGSHMSYRQIILFIYCWSKQLTSIRFCEEELDVSKTMVIDWNNYLREVCANSLINNPLVIGGPNMTGAPT